VTTDPLRTDWARERSRNGGADRIPLPVATGGLWLCGKHFIGPDPELALAKTGATTVVCLSQPAEIEDRYPDYARWLRADPRAIWFPVPDLHAPELDVVLPVLARLRDHVEAGEVLLVHCGAGIGRAGTIAAALLITMGLSLEDACATVAANRPMAGPEAGVQRQLLDRLEEFWSRSTT
jgi:protein-tyrosine phosphatase